MRCCCSTRRSGCSYRELTGTIRHDYGLWGRPPVPLRCGTRFHTQVSELAPSHAGLLVGHGVYPTCVDGPPPKPTSSVTSLLIGNCGKPAREGCDCGTFPALVTVPTRRRRLPVDGSIILWVASLAPLGPPRTQPRLCRSSLWKGVIESVASPSDGEQHRETSSTGESQSPRFLGPFGRTARSAKRPTSPDKDEVRGSSPRGPTTEVPLYSYKGTLSITEVAGWVVSVNTVASSMPARCDNRGRCPWRDGVVG